MEICRVAFFGHRDFSAHVEVEQQLYPILRELLQTRSYVEFYIGRDGEFDTFVASVIKRAQRTFGNENSELILVLPYRNMQNAKTAAHIPHSHTRKSSKKAY